MHFANINKAALSVLHAVHVWGKRSLTALISHGVFVKEVLSHAAISGSHSAQVGDPVRELFDRFNLLIQIMCFYEVAHLWGKKRTEYVTFIRSSDTPNDRECRKKIFYLQPSSLVMPAGQLLMS